MIRDSLIGIAIGYGLDDRIIGVGFPTGAGSFSSSHHVQTGSGAHPASYTMGRGALSLTVKWPRRKADHLPPSSAEVNEGVELSLHSHNTSSWRGA
jgi:hypothetical protein